MKSVFVILIVLLMFFGFVIYNNRNYVEIQYKNQTIDIDTIKMGLKEPIHKVVYEVFDTLENNTIYNMTKK